MRFINKKFLLGLLFFSVAASAAVVSRVTSFSDGEVLFASDLNSEFNNLISGINSINDDQLADNANIDPAKLSASIAGDGLSRNGTTGVLSVSPDDVGIEISSNDVSLKDGGVTNAKIRDSAALSVIGRSANSTGDVADISAGTDAYVLRRSGTTLGFGQIATGGIGDEAVTFAKRETREDSGVTASAGEIAKSNAVSSFVFPSGFNDITNLSVTLTTLGGPVILQLVASDDFGGVSCSNSSGLDGDVRLKFLRDATSLPTLAYGWSGTATAGDNGTLTLSPSQINFIDFPSAGTYTYKVQGSEGANNSCTADDMRLVAYEL